MYVKENTKISMRTDKKTFVMWNISEIFVILHMMKIEMGITNKNIFYINLEHKRFATKI